MRNQSIQGHNTDIHSQTKYKSKSPNVSRLGHQSLVDPRALHAGSTPLRFTNSRRADSPQMLTEEYIYSDNASALELSNLQNGARGSRMTEKGQGRRKKGNKGVKKVQIVKPGYQMK